MDCIFCKIANGGIPANIITETDKSLAFLDAFPLTKGHTLVIPKTHHDKIQYLSPEENADLFSTVYKVLAKVDSISGATLIAIHNGKEAGQEIPHVHVHLVPRSPHDNGGPIHCLFDSTINVSDSETKELIKKLKF